MSNFASGAGGVGTEGTCGTTGWGGVGIINCIVFDNASPQLDGKNQTDFSCVENGEGMCTGGFGNNITTDPVFVGNGSYALQPTSPCRDKGCNSIAATDFHDIDQDGNVNDKAPDLAGHERIIGHLHQPAVLCSNSPSTCAVVDMGAYEFGSASCLGNIATDGTSANRVDVDDLLAVILAWGPCPAGQLCSADIAPPPCGDNQVAVDDLLAVISAWGDCPGLEAGGEDDMPQSIADCMEKCTAQGYTGSQWSACVNRCVQGLCAAGIINCD